MLVKVMDTKSLLSVKKKVMFVYTVCVIFSFLIFPKRNNFMKQQIDLLMQLVMMSYHFSVSCLSFLDEVKVGMLEIVLYVLLLCFYFFNPTPA